MAWQKLIKFQKYARKIFMHIIQYIHTYWRGLYTFIYIHAHPINDEAFPTAPSTTRTRTRTPNATAEAAASVSHSRQSSESSSRRVESLPPPHLLCIFSAPPRYLLCTSSACRRCLQSAQTVSPVWLWNCLRAKLKTKTGSHQRSERVAQLLLLLPLLAMLLLL